MFVHPAFVAVAAADEDEDGEDVATWAGEDEVALHRDGSAAAAYT